MRKIIIVLLSVLLVVFLFACDGAGVVVQTYTIKYIANEAGSGTVPAEQIKTAGVDLSLASNSGELTKSGYNFAGWNTTADGSGTDYAEEFLYSVDADLDLYARWTEIIYMDPVAESISLIPVIGFNNPVQSVRMIVPIDTAAEQSMAAYSLMGPLLTSFKSVSDYTEDSDYSIALFDSYMDFSITVNDDSTITYEGTMRDNSGNISVTYDADAGSFSFEQTLYLDATAISVTQMKLAMYVTGTNLSITSDGYFHGLYNVAYIQKNNDDSWEMYTHASEIYRGVMNSSDKIGTGLTYCGDADADGTDGLRWFQSADGFSPSDYNSGMIIPTEVSTATLASWKEYLSSSEILTLDSDVVDDDPTRWVLNYKFDDSDISSVDGLDNSTYYAGFTQDGDLSTWRDKSLLLDLLN